MTKILFITGGVVSSLGKGLTAASLAAVIESRGFRVSMMKLDPYINVDPGTMSPFQHGEVFVTHDGAETDLDLGHYERFVSAQMTRANNFTTGQIYAEVIQKERKGDYLGETIQVIPHITDMIISKIKKALHQDLDFLLVEIGGTVGDIESLPFLESIRQLRCELGSEQTLYMHLTLVPYIEVSGEIKTKPTQHSVKELRSIGIQPDIIFCRTKQVLDDKSKKKIALFTNVPAEAVISLPDINNIYRLPLLLHEQLVDQLILRKLNVNYPDAKLEAWHQLIENAKSSQHHTRIAIIGKYVELKEAYKSLNEALQHAAIFHRSQLELVYIDAEDDPVTTMKQGKIDAILVPGGFGERGIEGKINAIQYARVEKIPFFGICLGMQLAVIEYARHVVGIADANSSEFVSTGSRVITLVQQWNNEEGSSQIRVAKTDKGGSMRLGAQSCEIAPLTLAAAIYKKAVIEERHRHRYEVNPAYVDQLKQGGLVLSGRSSHEQLIEMIEIEDHPWFLACQFHPEFLSKPLKPHPLFVAFIKAAIDQSDHKEVS